MQEALCKTLEESDVFLTQLSEIWCDEMTEEERDAVQEYLRPFMERFYNTEEENEVMRAWKEAIQSNSKKDKIK